MRQKVLLACSLTVGCIHTIHSHPLQVCLGVVLQPVSPDVFQNFHTKTKRKSPKQQKRHIWDGQKLHASLVNKIPHRGSGPPSV